MVGLRLIEGVWADGRDFVKSVKHWSRQAVPVN